MIKNILKNNLSHFLIYFYNNYIDITFLILIMNLDQEELFELLFEAGG